MKKITCFLIIAIALCLFSQTSYAYYQKDDWAEPFFILPNESAFWIPDVGDNKKGQSQFGSEAYLRESKIAAKRYMITHVKLDNSAFFSNFYVPTGRLIIVDRTPFNREWTKSVAKGTAAKDEGFDVQSKEGINITVGVSIAASVTEEDSPKFLFRFGVNPPQGDRTKPEVIFTSVYYGRSLAQVMDGVIRSKVQTLLGNEFTKRSFDDCNQKSAEIIENVGKALTLYSSQFGISIDFVGWADTFNFDRSIQDAINRVYIAKQDELIAKQLAPYTEIIKSLSIASTIRSFGDKTDGKLPTQVSLWWLPESISSFISNIAKTK